MTAELLAGEGLACQRGERLLFQGLGFTLGPGELLELVGPNGAGKSSLLRLVAGLLPPLVGRLAWGGVTPSEEPQAWRARIGWLGHLDGLRATQGVAATLRHWGRVLGGAVDTRALMDQVGLRVPPDLPCRALSAGQRRRLALARLAATGRPLWLLDEPLTALDTDGQGRLRALLTAHLAAGGRALAATHAPLGLAARRLDVAACAADGGGWA